MPNTKQLISIVDDDHSVRRALRRLVRFAGFSAEAFASAEDFLASASLLLTACLVLDIHLNGGMSGFDLQTKLTAEQILIPIIFITAHDNASLRECAETAGAAAYLCKPFNDELLLDAIRAAVGRDGHPGGQGPQDGGGP